MLTKCDECGSEISNKAEFCPKCGAKPERTGGFTKFVLFAAVAIVAFSWMISNSNDERRAAENQERAAEAKRVASLTPEQRAAEDKKKKAAAAVQAKESALSSARYICKNLVAKSLHDPDSAQFEAVYNYWAAEQSPGVYRVQVKLRAKNSFNALRNTVVDCTVKHVGTDWKPVSLHQLDS